MVLPSVMSYLHISTVLYNDQRRRTSTSWVFHFYVRPVSHERYTICLSGSCGRQAVECFEVAMPIEMAWGQRKIPSRI